MDVKMPGRTLQPLFHSSLPRDPWFPWDRPPSSTHKGHEVGPRNTFAAGFSLRAVAVTTGASGTFTLGCSESLLEKRNCGGFPTRVNNYVQMEGTSLGSEGIFRLLHPQN